MKHAHQRIALAIASAGLLTLYGCGGGGGGTTAVTTPVTITGVAATGAAFTDAVIAVYDATGSAVGTSSPTVGADGIYTVTLAAGAKAPFVIVATRTSADGVVDALVSVLKTAASGVVNITPVTHLIASRLSSSGDPLKLRTELAADNTLLTEAKVNAKVTEVQAILKPLLDAVGGTASNTDPLSGTFAANGSGYDRALDSLSIRIVPDVGMANIEIAVKQQQADDAQPVKVQFASNTAATIAPIAPPTALLPEGTSALISDFLSRLTACYALPLATRVSANGSAATDIIADACKSAFVGNNPAGFKNNGGVVGKGMAFNGIFVDGGTGVVFSQGSYEFTRANGDLVIGYKTRSSTGAETFDTFVVRKEADGKLRLIGNQYLYPGSVAAYHQLRKFITLDQSAYDYYSTGYNVNVSHITGGTGGTGTDGSIFNRVVVTTPKGNTLVLKPKSGSSNLELVKNFGTGSEVLTGTSFVRLNREYANTADSNDPALRDNTLFFANPRYTNAEVAALSAQATWKFDYYLAGNLTDAPDATQFYKTRARALTIPELKTKGLATLTAAAITDITAGANATTGTVSITNAASVALNYAVGVGALSPTSLKIWGGYTRADMSGGGFNDSVTVASTARTGTIVCSVTGVTDQHCTNGSYAASAYWSGAHLWAKDTVGREYASFYAMYKLATPAN